jgi:hypothetical protein
VDARTCREVAPTAIAAPSCAWSARPSGDAGAGGTSGIVYQLDQVEGRLAAYLASTAEERDRARQQEQAVQELNAYQLRVQRQQVYLDNLRKHEAHHREKQHRAALKVSSVFFATYRKPNLAYASIWKLLTAHSPDLFASLFYRNKPSSFGELHGWSFLFFNSPRRKKALSNAYTLPDTMMDWVKAERRAEDMALRVQEVGAELSQSMQRARDLQDSMRMQPPIQLDANRDREIRIRLFQERNAVLAQVAPQEIASSGLPEERKVALLSVLGRYHEQQTRGRGGR